MAIYPSLSITFLNGFLLMIPLLGFRFGIPALFRKSALQELDHFPSVQGWERIALRVYSLSSAILILSPLLAKIQAGGKLSLAGWSLYLGGLVWLIISLIQFSMQEGIKKLGIYRLSRNPIYLGYLLIFLGQSLLISSWFHLILTLVYQAAVHGLILSEERWCLEKFGESYLVYAKQTPRYLIF
jgi:hypothetical protein